MTPQSNFTIVAPVRPGRMAELREHLASMNFEPGRVNPSNSLIRFNDFEELQFARLLILDDQTLDDITVYGIPRREYPASLAFLGDVDGNATRFLNKLAARSPEGLRLIFSCCEDFSSGAGLAQWMKAHDVSPATSYVNFVGRTVRQVREEQRLRQALQRYVRQNAATLKDMPAQAAHAILYEFVSREKGDGRLMLSPHPRTPFAWKLRNFIHLLSVPVLLLLFLPVLLIAAIPVAIALRLREKKDAEICPRLDPAYSHQLSIIEDHQVTNQFSAFGTLKPGLFRRWLLTFILWIIDWTTRHIYIRGRLARVQTIHFARWVFLNEKRRLFFASDYDGSLDSYMDDFINKVAFGLNAVFSNGVGYPKTNWLLLDGAKDEQKFKYYIRRHELPTAVWYNACPGLTAFDRRMNSRIRSGAESPAMSTRQASEWLGLL